MKVSGGAYIDATCLSPSDDFALIVCRLEDLARHISHNVQLPSNALGVRHAWLWLWEFELDCLLRAYPQIAVAVQQC